MRDLLKRIEDLEEQYKDEPLIVLAIMPDGEKVAMPARECLEKKLPYERVVAGSSLKDLDLLLQAIQEEAFRQAESVET